MNLDLISKDSRKKILKLIPKNNYLIKNTENHKILLDLKNGNSVINQKSLDYLFRRKLITIEKKITPLGEAVIISLYLEINLLSTFILARIWATQKKDPEKMFITRHSLEDLLCIYNERTIDNCILKLRDKQFLYSARPAKVLKIQPIAFDKLKSYTNELSIIINYVNTINDNFYEILEYDTENIHKGGVPFQCF